MSTAVMLPEGDLRALLAVVEDGRGDAPGPGLPWAVLDGLATLITCDEVEFCELDLVGHGPSVQQSVFGGGSRYVELEQVSDLSANDVYEERYQRFPARSCSAGDTATVTRWSDIFSSSELRREPLYADFFRTSGVKHVMSVDLPCLPGRTRRILFWRHSGTDFTNRDKLILELLRPHLDEVCRQARRRRDGTPRFTDREWQVVELVAQGYGNADIARLLVTSISTIRKHMEHIFDRTGVRTRSAVIATLMH